MSTPLIAAIVSPVSQAVAEAAALVAVAAALVAVAAALVAVAVAATVTVAHSFPFLRIFSHASTESSPVEDAAAFSEIAK